MPVKPTEPAPVASPAMVAPGRGSSHYRGPNADGISELLGRVLVTITCTLFGFAGTTFFFVLLPGLPWRWRSRVELVALGLPALTGLLVNYAKAVLTDPGLPPDQEAAAALPESSAWETCAKCTFLKPPRTHHCRVCDRCVLKMDHHCPWVNNCVGFHNYRYFCAFMLYLALCCIIVLLTSVVPTLDVLFFPQQSRWGTHEGWCIALSASLCLGTLVALTVIGGSHVYLLMTNQTTIEARANQAERDKKRTQQQLARFTGKGTVGPAYRSPYDLGVVDNVAEVCGPGLSCCFSWLPPGPNGSGGDGLSFHLPEEETSGSSVDGCIFGFLLAACVAFWFSFWAFVLVCTWSRIWVHARS